MIQLTSIDIKDFGRHHHIDSKFSGHVVGLAGPNGRGKSTVLQAIQFALTGTIAHKDPLRAFIRRSSCENPPAAAEVTLEFVADGKVGKIQRRITRTTVTRKLWWDGAKTPMTSDEKVNETMFAILGVDKKAINSTVFIRQGEMANMFGEETDRRDFYTRLLMLGHLAKLALTIETYRESTASSVQDLGAVRDAAQRTYDEARVYFEQCEREQAEAPSASENLSLVRAVEAVMARVTAAEDAVTEVCTKLAHVVPADEPDVALWLTNAQQQDKKWQEKLEQLTQQKQAHLSASAELSKTELALANMRALKQQFVDLNAAVTALSAADSTLGDSPEPSIKKAEATLQKFADFALLGTTIPEAVKSEESVRPKLAAAETEVTSWEQIYNTARENYAVLRDALKLRRELLSGIEGCEHIKAEPCPLCGGKESPDPDRLRSQIAEFEQSLELAKEKGTSSGEALRERIKTRDALKEEHKNISYALDQHRQNQKRLRIELSLTTKEAVTVTLDGARAQLKAWHARAFERDRLFKEVTRLRGVVTGKNEPTPSAIEELAGAEELQRKWLLERPWGALQIAALHAAVEQAKSTRKTVDDAQEQIAAVEAAKTNAKTATDARLKVLAHIPQGLFDLGKGAPVLTPQIVQDKLLALEQAQQAHDTAKGRRDAANEALKAASGRIDELDLRTAEQQQRLKLVKDLELLRDTFKPNGASLDFLNYKFGGIAKLAADYLAESGADFMVAASDEIPLAYDFLRTDRADEVWMPQNRMSGGQKVRLAVATLRALHAIIMPNVGLLVLDEPTTHLDEEAKRSMAEMLQKIGEEGTLQLVVCDHSPTLIDAFSDRIEIPA